MRLSEAVDLYLGELSRQGRTASTQRTYGRILGRLADEYRFMPVEAITRFDCMTFLDHWQNRSRATKALHTTILRSFFEFCRKAEIIPDSPMRDVDQPKRTKAEDLDVTSITAEDLDKMFRACRTWQEKICLAILAFSGVRRGAATQLRWRDVRFETGHIRFHEKGGKTVWKPMPHILHDLLERARASGVRSEPEDFVIPWYHAQNKSDTRDGRFIWNIVKNVAERVGIEAHVHAFRSLFAVHYLETHEGDLETLRLLMGHESVSTTQGYARKANRNKLMERVRDLDYGSALLGESRCTGAGELSAVHSPPSPESALTEGDAETVGPWPAPTSPSVSTPEPGVTLHDLPVAAGLGFEPRLADNPHEDRDVSERQLLAAASDPGFDLAAVLLADLRALTEGGLRPPTESGGGAPSSMSAADKS